MKKKILILVLQFLLIEHSTALFAEEPAANAFPVKAFGCTSPRHAGVDRFVKFIDEELAPRGVNTLIVFVCDKDYNYQFESHPQLGGTNALSKADVKKLVAVCKKNKIRIIPQINLLGHQSWREHPNKLLEQFPQFDETPDIKMPDTYVWPNSDNLYCKSYCPLHPDLHKVIFALIDEICDVFESDAFHAGMDEVFILGDEKCPRCAGIDKAELYAGEVNRIRNHLAERNRELWIWGDRLIDGKSTGIGRWEGSYNYTYRAIDMIPKDVVICDWHYERPDPTPVYFAMKGFRVITCTGGKPETGVTQAEKMVEYRRDATPEMQSRYLGVMQTVWSGTEDFMNSFDSAPDANRKTTAADAFKALYKRVNEIESGKP